MIPINFRELKYAIDMFTIEKHLNKKNSENNQQWMRRVSIEVFETYSDFQEIELLRDTNKFENVGVFLFKALISLARIEKNYKAEEELNELFDIYRNKRLHTQVQTLKIFDFIMKPGKQTEVKEILLVCFKILQVYLMFHAENGYIPSYEILQNWVEKLDDYPSYLIKPNKLKISIATHPEEIKKYSHIKKTDSSAISCNARCIMQGKPVLCSREKGHDNVHVARLPFIGVIAVWEE